MTSTSSTGSPDGESTPQTTAAPWRPTVHHMGRRSSVNNYSQPGMYHVTVHVAEEMGQPLGRVAGDARQADGHPGAPCVELSPLGLMVEQELLGSIPQHYPMVEIQDRVVMPEHLHFIIEVHAPIVSRQGKPQHLGQVIAGFKKGCNRRFWAMTGQEAPASPAAAADTRRGKPAGADSGASGGANAGTGGGANAGADGGAGGGANAGTGGGANTGADGSRPAVYPQGYKVPSRGSTGRPPLFAPGYVDVMPLHKGQLAQQRAYIKGNPRSRLLRSSHRDLLQADRSGIDTALTVTALMSYLVSVCHPSQLKPDTRQHITQRLLTRTGKKGNAECTLVDCHSYGDRRLLEQRLLPVVCHQRDQWRFAEQKERCLQAASEGAVLVSPRIAKGEQEIMDEAAKQGFPVILLIDNGMDKLYHPSQERIERCLAGRLLIVTPWQYRYRKAEERISVAECKAMNCVAQALCRKRDDWWQQPFGGVNPPTRTAAEATPPTRTAAEATPPTRTAAETTPPTRTAAETAPPTRTGGMGKALTAMLMAVLLTGCSLIDDDLSDCPDYTVDYELRLVTNMTTEIQTQLTAETDMVLASTLHGHLDNVFTDYAHDVDLAFYDISGDSVRLYHDEHIMDANQHSYSLDIPRRKYMHLAVANVVDNPMVELQQGERCHDAVLRRGVMDENHQDTLVSHNTGLFTARQHMEMVDSVDQMFNVHLYMANCAAALVIDPRGQDTKGLQVFTTGFATTFNIADSTYTYSDTPHIISTTSVETGNDQLCFCSVTFPSPEPQPERAAARGTRSIIETTEPFLSEAAERALWQVRIYVPQADGSITESILYVTEPLRAGQLKIIKCWLGPNGAAETQDQTVGVSVTLDWNDGTNHEVPL